ncbi:MAG: tyrosine-type recombinase/integrase [Flavobacteriales bacterium]|nr:tyrosine-type recombinase/integrase [Flavobacteriales bacterium]
MSLQGCRTTADYLNWNDMFVLVQKLNRDSKHKLALLVAAGSYTGLRISDLLTLRWDHLLTKPHLIITEQKTSKRRRIKINGELLEVSRSLFDKCRVQRIDELIFLNSKTGKVFTVQHLNRLLKVIRVRYRLNIDNFSTHTLRKTFGRHIWEQSGYSERAITLLSEIFNHSSYRITRRYLGINDEDIDSVYELL